MQPANYLLKDKENFPLLGLDSFNTFLKVCLELSEWALDDVGLANRANAYRIWVCWIKPQDNSKLKGILERYESMKLLLHYLDINIVENNKIGLYIKLDYLENKWEMSYGITNNKKLFKIGGFDYTLNTKLPESKILKYILDDIDDFNPREHLLLFKIKNDMFGFDPGFCKRTDPQLINKDIVISCHGLGQWHTDETIMDGEADKYLQIFKKWVAEQKWWNLVSLILVPRKNKWIDFKIKLK